MIGRLRMISIGKLKKPLLENKHAREHELSALYYTERDKPERKWTEWQITNPLSAKLRNKWHRCLRSKNNTWICACKHSQHPHPHTHTHAHTHTHTHTYICTLYLELVEHQISIVIVVAIHFIVVVRVQSWMWQIHLLNKSIIRIWASCDHEYQKINKTIVKIIIIFWNISKYAKTVYGKNKIT